MARLLLEGCPFDNGENMVEVESCPVQSTTGRKLSNDKFSRNARNKIDRDNYGFDIIDSNDIDKTLINTCTQTIDRVEQHFRELLFVGCKRVNLYMIQYIG